MSLITPDQTPDLVPKLLLPPSPPTSESDNATRKRYPLRALLIPHDVSFSTSAWIPSFPYRYNNVPISLKNYGVQMTSAPIPLRDVLLGQLPITHALRREQINRYVTSGHTVDGRASGYGNNGRNLERAARVAEHELSAQKVLPLGDILIYECQVRFALPQWVQLILTLAYTYRPAHCLQSRRNHPSNPDPLRREPPYRTPYLRHVPGFIPRPPSLFLLSLPRLPHHIGS